MIRHLTQFIAAATLIGATLVASPALAVTWGIYAPDEDGHRYWIDTDSIQQRGDYIYFTFLILGTTDPAPTASAGGSQFAIKCATGESLKLDASGAWVAGPPFTDAAYLYKWICKR